MSQLPFCGFQGSTRLLPVLVLSVVAAMAGCSSHRDMARSSESETTAARGGTGAATSRADAGAPSTNAQVSQSGSAGAMGTASTPSASANANASASAQRPPVSGATSESDAATTAYPLAKADRG